ncbi:MAG: hypothetical protein UX89_C0006G0012 [Parcubacteria group bacterium GW2011_GWA2_47_16]|nr:MAG: hypothetical protein UX89_C0006G0012 [Parcubacteria group bacterium GW2011_GWA2_47_16]
MRFFNEQTSGGTKKIFVASILFSLAIVGAYCYLWVKIVQKTQNIGVLLGEVETLNTEREVFAAIKGRIEETVEVRDKLAGFFIPKDGVVAFLNGIQALGVENKLKFKVDSVVIEDEAEAPDSFENVKLNIEASGAWADIYRFVALAELMPLRVLADKVNLEVEVEEIQGDTSSKKRVVSSEPVWRSSVVLRVLKLK